MKERLNGSAKFIPIYVFILSGLVAGFIAWGRTQEKVDRQEKVGTDHELRIKTAEIHAAVDDQRFIAIQQALMENNDALRRIERYQHQR